MINIKIPPDTENMSDTLEHNMNDKIKNTIEESINDKIKTNKCIKSPVIL